MNALQNLLIVFAFINLLFAAFIYFHSNRGRIVMFYSLISVFASLWALATLSTALPNLPFPYWSAAISFHYIFGYLAYLSFFWFTLYYPKRIRKLLAPAVILTFLTILPLALIPTTKYVFVATEGGGGIAERLTLAPFGYWAFVIMLSTVFVFGLLILAYRLLKEREGGSGRSQIFFALSANLVAGTLGITLNLLLPFWGDFSFFYVNPILVTIALTGFGLYNLFRFQFFNIRVVIAELFTFGIWIVLLFRFTISTDFQERITNAAFFVVTVLFGIFLIRSVNKEVEIREELEILTKRLEKANVRLKQLDKLKTEFVSIASHQLRSPLAAVKGYASMLLEGSFGKLSVGAHEAIGRIFTSSSFMARSVDDFLNVSRIELGRMKYEVTKFDICKIINLVVEEQKPFAKEKKLKLDYIDKTGTGSCQVKADVGKVKQVLTNLVDNAIKYTPKGSVTVIFDRNRTQKKICIDVKDTGMGMSEETRKKLFKKFARSERANEVNVIGTGLGLFVAKNLSEAQGGRIWVTSPGEGKGSTFHIELPDILEKQVPQKQT